MWRHGPGGKGGPSVVDWPTWTPSAALGSEQRALAVIDPAPGRAGRRRIAVFWETKARGGGAGNVSRDSRAPLAIWYGKGAQLSTLRSARIPPRFERGRTTLGFEKHRIAVRKGGGRIKRDTRPLRSIRFGVACCKNRAVFTNSDIRGYSGPRVSAV